MWKAQYLQLCSVYAVRTQSHCTMPAPLSPHWSLFKSSYTFNIRLQPHVHVLIVVLVLFSDWRSHVSNVLSCDTKITAVLLVLGEVSSAGHKILASWSFLLSSFAHSLPPPLSFFLLLSFSFILNVAIEKSNNLYSPLKIICSFRLCCCCSVTKLCLTLCKPMTCGPPGVPVFYYLP